MREGAGVLGMHDRHAETPPVHHADLRSAIGDGERANPAGSPRASIESGEASVWPTRPGDRDRSEAPLGVARSRSGGSRLAGPQSRRDGASAPRRGSPTAPFVSDREREILEAVARMATSNPFAPDRIEQERRALGADFVPYADVWHMDDRIEGLDPNLSKLSRVAETLAEELRARLASGVRTTPQERGLYEGFVRYLLFYRYSSELTKLIEEREKGRSATRKLAFYPRYAADFAHFLQIPGVEFPPETDAAGVLAWGFQIRRAFYHTFTRIYGSSLPIAALRGSVWQAIFTHDIDRYRRSLTRRMADIPVLVLGASGTGKELVARAIGMSRFIPLEIDERTNEARFAADYALGYQAVNLAALSASLVESELFGHRRGAFTGAVDDHAGWLEGCGRHGTIFLDEIGDLDPAIQVKLLRVLQSRTFQRIGETEERRFEGKIVAATKRRSGARHRRGSLPRGPLLPALRERDPAADVARADRLRSRRLSPARRGDRGANRR